MSCDNPDDEGLTLYLRIGEGRFPLAGGTLTTSIRELSHAQIKVSAGELAAGDADYLLPVEIGPALGDPVQDGSVLTAEPEGDNVALHIRTGVSLTETLAPDGDAQGVHHTELVYAMARGAGFPPENIVIQDLDKILPEAIEVAVPLVGVEVDREVSIGLVKLAPRQASREIISRFHPSPTLADEFLSGLTVARFYATHPLLYDAEQEGLEHVQTALSWLMVRANYGRPTLPDGDLVRFDRANAIARPRQLSVTAVTGLMTGRRWLRRPPGARIESRVVFDARSRLDSPQVPADLPASDANALSAARRAITPGDLALRTHALWEAFEFYVAHRPSAGLFTKADRDGILAASKESLSSKQLRRLGQVVYGPLNELPLMDKLVAALLDEGIVLTNTDRAVLARLRKARNQTMHGRPTDGAAGDLEHGCSILTRALVTRLHVLNAGQ
jgi:hypothetical protein